MCIAAPCVGLFNVFGRRREGEREREEVRRKARFGSSSMWFTTDGYCLEFQGHDLTLRALSLYLTGPVGYELIKRNTSLDIVSSLLSDYRLSPEIGLLRR